MSKIPYLQWRAAIKKYDPSRKLSQDQVEVLLEALNLSPSSYGLQPYHFLLITNEQLRKDIQAASYNQPQITEASHLIVVASQLQMDEADVDRYMQRITEVRGGSVEYLKGYADMILNSVKRKTSEEIVAWNAHQAYLALGTMLTVAAEQKIDATPMEGFDAAKVDALLGLRENGFTTSVLVPVGFRDENDPYLQRAKVRKKIENIVTRVE